MVAYTCQKADEFEGGACVLFGVSKDEQGHFAFIKRVWDTKCLIERSGYWAFYVDGKVVSEHNLDSLNAKAEEA